MIFCIDIGNTNVKYGVFSGDNLVASFRVASSKNQTADEYGIVVKDLLESAKISKNDIEGVILSSVIPQLNYTMMHMCEYFLGHTPIVIGPGVKTGLNIKVDNPREVGADRIVNSVAAYCKYGKIKPVICIDFGTATTFNVISVKGEFLGGVIAPGIKGSLDSLVNGTAQLPNIELELPKRIIAKSTVTNMQAGLLYGFSGLVEKIVFKMKKELKCDDVIVVATGGLSETIFSETPCINVIDRMLTLEGLKLLYDMNRIENDEESKNR